MTDITLTVAFGLAAFGVSLAASGRVVNEIARAACYSAITLMGFNQLGVTVSAPITSNSADMLNIATVAWLIVALGACCVSGLVRPLLNSSRT